FGALHARGALRPGTAVVPGRTHAGNGRRSGLRVRALRRGLMGALATSEETAPAARQSASGGLAAALRQSLFIAAKDLRAELRTKEAINAALAFALVILVLFSFAFDPLEDTTRAIAGGLLWIAFAFAGTLVLNRSFARELPNDCLDALVAAPVSAACLFLGKALANYLLVLGVEMIALPVFGVFYNVHWTQFFWQLMLVLLLGNWGLT